MPALDVTPESAPPCPAHPDRKAYRACDRCGTFLCAVCTFPTETGPLCEPCTRLRPVTGEPLWTTFFLPLSFMALVSYPVLTALAVFINFGFISDRLHDPATSSLWIAGMTSVWGLLIARGAVALWIVPQFLMRRRRVPVRMILFYAMDIVASLLGIALLPENEIPFRANGPAIIVSFVWSAGWIAYFALAPKVKRVFVR